jgi:allantoin racemase
MRRILVINSNTSAAATQRIADVLQRHTTVGTQVTVVNPSKGPQGIDTLLDIAISGLESARLVAAHHDEYDAFVIACSADPGLDIARQVTDKPVVGICEAAVLMACTLGATFAIVAQRKVDIRRIREQVARYGLTGRLASVPSIDLATAELLQDVDRLYQRLLLAAHQAVEVDLAEVVILAGSVMAGFEEQLRDDVEVPVLSGTVCALKLVEGLIDLGVRTSKVYKYAPMKKLDRLQGYPGFQDVYSR